MVRLLKGDRMHGADRSAQRSMGHAFSSVAPWSPAQHAYSHNAYQAGASGALHRAA